MGYDPNVIFIKPFDEAGLMCTDSTNFGRNIFDVKRRPRSSLPTLNTFFPTNEGSILHNPLGRYCTNKVKGMSAPQNVPHLILKLTITFLARFRGMTFFSFFGTRILSLEKRQGQDF